jgi:hypothetical protein
MSRSTISLAAEALCAGNFKIDDSRLARPSPAAHLTVSGDFGAAERNSPVTVT